MTFITTGGLSIDFPQTEKDNYYVATEDGTVHRCSVSYSEQYLDTYYGHSGPVYKVRCSPFWSPQECQVFLTCSYDWTIRVWNHKESPGKQCKLVCANDIKEQVNDVEWSPFTSSLFAMVAEDGRIELWDLKNNIEPRLSWWDRQEGTNAPIKTAKTCVRWSRASPVIVTGNT